MNVRPPCPVCGGTFNPLVGCAYCKGSGQDSLAQPLTDLAEFRRALGTFISDRQVQLLEGFIRAVIAESAPTPQPVEAEREGRAAGTKCEHYGVVFSRIVCQHCRAPMSHTGSVEGASGGTGQSPEGPAEEDESCPKDGLGHHDWVGGNDIIYCKYCGATKTKEPAPAVAGTTDEEREILEWYEQACAKTRHTAFGTEGPRGLNYEWCKWAFRFARDIGAEAERDRAEVAEHAARERENECERLVDRINEVEAVAAELIRRAEERASAAEEALRVARERIAELETR